MLKIKKIIKYVLASLAIAGLAIGLSLAVDMAIAAFETPGCVPPGCNEDEPINISSDSQEKIGFFNIDPWQIAPLNESDSLSVYSNDSSHSAIYAQQDGSGYAIYASGKTKVSGEMEVVGNITSKGTSWTSRTNIPNNNWYSVTYGNGLFVAVAYSGTGDRVMTSPDGINWTSRTSAADNYWTSVTYGNGLFVAVAIDHTNNRIMTSPDGINWTIRTTPGSDKQWKSVAYGNGLFVVVAFANAGSGIVAASSNGINWTSRIISNNNNWKSVVYGNGLFVAVAISGTGDRVMTSPDGINWTSRTNIPNNNWYSVTYGNGLFVAVASSGTGDRVMTSPDGINWTSRTNIPNNNWHSVTYGNGLFVAVAYSGTGDGVMTSPDGINWTSRISAADENWTSVTYGNGLFVAVANSGTNNRVMTSGKAESNTVPANNIYHGGMSINDKLTVKANSSDSAIYAEQSGSGYAGYFSGKVDISGNLLVGHSDATNDKVSIKSNDSDSAIYAKQSGSGYAGYFSGNVSVKTDDDDSAIYAEQSGSGYALYASGKANIDGNLEVEGKISAPSFSYSNRTCSGGSVNKIWSQNGHCYSLFGQTENSLNWLDALSFCNAWGGYLATITSTEEQSFIGNEIPLASSAWIGGTDYGVEKSWQWITREPWSYWHWATGQPNDSGGQECLNMLPNVSLAYWDDGKCGTDLLFICESE